MLKIEQFIEEQFGIKLNSQQLQIITMMSTGQISLSQSINKKVFGNDVVQKSVYAWFQHGLVKTNKPDISLQKDLINFIKDPKTISKAVQGSMDKRNALLADVEIEEILDDHAEYYIKQTIKFFREYGESPAISKNNGGDLKAKKAIKALTVKTRIDEVNTFVDQLSNNHHDMPIGTPVQYINEQQMIRIAHLNTGIKQLNKGVENAS